MNTSPSPLARMLHAQFVYLGAALLLTAIPVSRDTLLYLIPVCLSQVSIRQHLQMPDSDLARQVQHLSHLHILLCMAAMTVIGWRSHPAPACAGAVTLGSLYLLTLRRKNTGQANRKLS